MAKNIDPELRAIGDYLKLNESTIFVIPEYQRAYSWNTENCDKLWQDINDYIEAKGEDRYFFGTVIISCENEDSEFALIDGQQRTTTFLLLLKALLLKINNSIGHIDENDEDSATLLDALESRRKELMSILCKTDKDNISRKPSPKDATWFEKVKLFDNRSINEKYSDDLGTILSSNNYEEAEQKVHKTPHKQKDNKYTNFFRNFKFFYGKIDDLSDSELKDFTKALLENCEVIQIKSWQVEQAISMFNSLNSDGMPLRDSDIISAKLYANAKGDGKQFESLWRQLNDELKELDEARILNLDSLLMQQMYYLRTVNGDTQSSSGKADVTTPGLRRYFTEINKDILSAPLDLCKSLINLAGIWKKIKDFPKDYPAMSILLKFNDNAKYFLASYFFRFKDAENLDKKEVEELAECMLRLFAVLELVDTGYSSSLFKTFLFNEEIKLADPNVSLEEIKLDFDAHIRSKWKREDLKLAVNEYEKNVLVYLNEYLFAKKHLRIFNLDSTYDIEHIMPGSGQNISEIQKDADIESSDEFKSIVNKLGNKILLEAKINRGIGNEWFRSKIGDYGKSSYPLARALADTYQDIDKSFWTKEDIFKATDKAGERIVSFIFNE